MKTLLSAILGLGLISGVAFAEEKPATPPEAAAPATVAGTEHKEAKKKKNENTKKGKHAEKPATDAH